MPDRFVVVIVLWVETFENTAESGPIAFVRRRLLGGALIAEGKGVQVIPGT